MHISVVLTLFFATSAFSFPTEQKKSVVVRTAPATLLEIWAWNTTATNCAVDAPNVNGYMGPNESTWGNGGSYTGYWLGRDLASNETINLFSSSGNVLCGTFLYSIPAGTPFGCYQLGTNETFSCMKIGGP